MFNKIVKLSIFIFLYTINIYAGVNIENILANIEEKNDLSLKTREENGGVSYIFTRQDLESMQVRHLSDILKSTDIGYNFSRYNILDPLNPGGSSPFSSGSVKIFIDNQEISSALYGSGLVVLGDMDLGFVDHVEIYTQSPSFEHSTEPALITIKLYSKIAKRDSGEKISFGFGSYGTNFQSFQSADTLKNFSYLFYLSRDKNGRKKYQVDGVDTKRDVKSYDLFSSIDGKKQKLLIKASKVDKGGFFGISLDGKPDTSSIKADTLHIGYNNNYFDNFYFSFMYDNMYNETLYKESVLTYYNNLPISSFYVKSHSSIYTIKMRYKIDTKKNRLIIGEKYRYKHFLFDNIQFNGVELPRYGHTKQSVNTIFLQNSYDLKKNLIITSGLSYGYITNNGNVPNQHTLLYRIGLTHLWSNWILKTYFSHIESAIDPYLINSFYTVRDKFLKTQKVDMIIGDLKYKKDKDRYEAVAGYFVGKDYILPNTQGLLDNVDSKIKEKLITLRWIHSFAPLNKLHLSFNYQNIKNIPGTKTLNLYQGVIRHVNAFDRYNIFEEMVYNQNSKDYKNYFDLSLGVKYKINKKINIAIKGVNLLDNAKESSYYRINTTTLKPENPFYIPLTDRKVLLTLEYFFE